MLLEKLNAWLRLGFDPIAAPALVALFYWFRFHTSKGTRSYTSKPLFAFGVVAFMIPFVLLYQGLSYLLPPLTSIWLLIFVWLVPILPVRWRDLCQSLAGIPAGALALRDELAASPFLVPPGDEPVLQRRLARIGYHVDDFRAVQSTAIQSRFMKISAIMFHLERWAADRESFMERNGERYAEFLAVFDVLCFRTVRVLKNSRDIYAAIMEDSHVEPDDWQALDSLSTRNTTITKLQLAAQTAAGSMLEDLRKDMDSMLGNLMLFAARAALAGELNLGRSKRRLSSIGFTLEPASPGILRYVAKVTAFTFAWCLFWLLSSGWVIGIPGEQSAGAIRTLVMLPLYVIMNFSLVYYCKRQFAFANENIFGQFPIGFILSIGLLGALFTLPAQIVFDHWQFPEGPDLDVALSELPVLIFPWGIGAMAAWLVQDSTWDNRSEKTRRLRDGLVFGCGMTLLLVILVLIHWISPVPVMTSVDHHSVSEFLLYFVAPTFLFGFIIGCGMFGRLRDAAARRQVRAPILSAAPTLAHA